MIIVKARKVIVSGLVLVAATACSQSPKFGESKGAPTSQDAVDANNGDAKAEPAAQEGVSEAYEYVSEERVAALMPESRKAESAPASAAKPSAPTTTTGTASPSDTKPTQAPATLNDQVNVTAKNAFAAQLAANPGALNAAQVSALTAKINGIVAAAQGNNPAVAAKALNAFMAEVNAVKKANFALIGVVDDLIQIAMDLVAAAIDLDVAGILDAVQDLIALVIDLVVA